MTTKTTRLLSVGALSMGLLLTACDGGNITSKAKKVDCSNEVGLSALKDLIIHDAERQLKAESFSTPAIRATLEKLNISFTEIRTSYADPNSTKVACEASLNISLPTDLYNDINEAVKVSGAFKDTDDLLEVSNYQSSAQAANVFYTNISYSLQPTDDGKQVFAKMDDSPEEYAVGAIASWALSKDNIIKSAKEEQRYQEQLANEEKEAEETIKETAKESAKLDRQLTQAQADKQKAELAKTQKEYKEAVAVINKTWEKLDKETQSDLKDEQIAVNKEREARCKKSALEVEGSATEQEIERLNCAIGELYERNSELEGYL